MQKNTETTSAKKENQTTLASEQGLEVKKGQEEKTQSQNSNQGKLLPNTASIEEIKASIPGRQNTSKANVSANKSVKVQGLPNTATLEEIKKTIPKN